MFSSKLFKEVACPKGDACQLPSCVFSHDASVLSKSSMKKQVIEHEVEGGDRKRVKLNNGTGATSRPLTQGSSPFMGILTSKLEGPPKNNTTVDDSWSKFDDKVRAKDLHKVKPNATSRQLPPTSTHSSPELRPNSQAKASSISPLQQNTTTKSTSKNAPKSTPAKHANVKTPATPSSTQSKASAEDLNPRLVTTSPASHAVRLKYVQLIHEQFLRLNTAVANSTDEAIKQHKLSPGNLIKLALDKEEHVARNQPLVYKQVMGLNVVQMRKETPEGFVITIIESKGPKEFTPSDSPFAKELTPELEGLMIARYSAKLDGLDKHGYVIKAPSQADIASAKKANELSAWETCDRCTIRFEVFPNRREDGALTSSGQCRHHSRRSYRDRNTKQQMYPCCNKRVGEPGCTIKPSHVFKTSDPARLANDLQFESTPENPVADPSMAVAFDCEMGYTTLGMEIIRISACTWPAGEQLFDALVRPFGQILDLNTQFSGVTTEQFFNAPDYSATSTRPISIASTASAVSAVSAASSTASAIPPTLQKLSSPKAARELLCSYLSPSTPLIGHSIENDLNVIRLLHPTIVDTIFLFPHSGGLPYRNGLRNLTKNHLSRDIQTGGAAGHDSLEDARATGDLVRARISRDWKTLRADGWRVGEDSNGVKVFVPPADGWEEKGAGRDFNMPPAKWWLTESQRVEEEAKSA
ncbi:hypothetical protein BT63DRAFT_423943 [Microthyrium microscopicum]|uniref:Exonuclease domain-containing protein n=1 Tax=Microthyrium microscopicum TaxID=703497 RepID=A0A6A6UCT8_9PEZI|nr:hypothetical protein BT63DRAFT_423943 [Microthyrium microscopicum]